MKALRLPSTIDRMRNHMLLVVFLSCSMAVNAQPDLHHIREGRSIIFTDESGNRLRITPYGNDIIRVQAVRKGEDFFPDDRYEMVEKHQWPGVISLKDKQTSFTLSPETFDGITVSVNRKKLLLSFARSGTAKPFLIQSKVVAWNRDTIFNSFVYDDAEHFTGLGHGFLGRAENIDLKGQFIARNYGTEHTQQAPLLVPFYLSNKGYGVFVNSTFPNTFSFGDQGKYEFTLSGDGRMDFFVILGPGFPKILDRYTQLTGRPRLPPRSCFGLALSDKGNDHTTNDPSDEHWWKQKIMAHRKAGFPLDHIINDNRWRAGGGQRCISYYAWDSTRYPDPREYQTWIRSNGLISTIDFNRCIAVNSEGWKPAFNLPVNDGIEFNTSAPDFTKKVVRDWFWDLMWKKSIDPALGYPGDALWIDEFDEMGKAPLSMRFENGSTWKEMKNYWFFLIAKSLVQQGWDKRFQGTKRPFVWVRGMTAGAQRYATLWSGDIDPTYSEMKKQIRGMQLAGLSAFPFWGHDAGGFQKEPDDTVFTQWAMAMGSFSPFWKPHGIGRSRWPLDRSAEAQQAAKLYGELRYILMPYTYTFAHLASEKGMPVARAMLIDHQDDLLAWKSDLEYMWGDEILVAPNCSAGEDVQAWLPKGNWYDFWDDKKLDGDKVIDHSAPLGRLPLFIKAGSIIPMANFALSTTFIPDDSLSIHVYTGKDGSFDLYEDDGVSEAYKEKNESRTTVFRFVQSTLSLNIEAVRGDYKNAAKERAYVIIFHGLSKPVNFEVNSVKIQEMGTGQRNTVEKNISRWDQERRIQSIFIKRTSVTRIVKIKRVDAHSH